MGKKKGQKMLCNFREFLNRKFGHYCSGNIVATVERECEFSDGTPDYDITFRIADCSGVISLDFCAFSAQERRDGKHKLAVLRRALDEFEAAYLKACEEMNAQAWKKGKGKK